MRCGGTLGFAPGNGFSLAGGIAYEIGESDFEPYLHVATPR